MRGRSDVGAVTCFSRIIPARRPLSRSSLSERDGALVPSTPHNASKPRSTPLASRASWTDSTANLASKFQRQLTPLGSAPSTLSNTHINARSFNQAAAGFEA